MHSTLRRLVFLTVISFLRLGHAAILAGVGEASIFLRLGSAKHLNQGSLLAE